MYIRPIMMYFGSPSCEKCISYYNRLSKLISLNSKNFRFINGDDFDDKDTQNLCDQHNVNEYPHVKIYILNKCVYEEVGELNIQEICKKMTLRIDPQDAGEYTTS